MIAYIEHHPKVEGWGWGCSVFNNDVDFDPVGIGEWFYLAGQDKPNYPMPVTASVAALSVYHQDGSPLTIWPYAMVKNELSFLR